MGDDLLRLNFYILAGLLLLGAAWVVVEHLVRAALPSRPVHDGAPERAQPQQAAPVHAPAAQSARQPVHAPVHRRAEGRALHAMPPERRMHTLIAARPGDGKTTALNTLLVADVQSGAQVVVLNPHYTAYHPEDQPIDLRPMAHAFEAVYDEQEIGAAMRALVQMVHERMHAYRSGEDVGHPVSVLIDEWPAIATGATGEACTDALMRLVREGRKCKIFVTLAAQDGQVGTLKFPGGLRSSFHTCLVGNVDATSWRALMGDEPRRPVAKGTWATPDGDVQVVRPTPAVIDAIATGDARYSAIQSENSALVVAGSDSDDRDTWEAEVVRLAAEGQSTRAILRQLGGNYNEIVRLAAIGRALKGDE